MTTKLFSRSAPTPGNVCFRTQSLRWASYDKTALTRAAIEDKVKAGLKMGRHRDSPRFNAARKTVSTAMGELPISPVFNPDWIKARRRLRKDNPSEPTGRFRKKLASNPFAQALATPIRRCANTFTFLPRYFLQDFELVKHPSDESVWWAPGLSAFEHLERRRADPVTAATVEDLDKTIVHAQSTEPDGGANAPSTRAGHIVSRRKSPVTVYILSQEDIVNRIGGSNKRHLALMLATRGGMAVSPEYRKAEWRQDMAAILLQIMRSHATETLIMSLQFGAGTNQPSIQTCETWDLVKEVKGRGCVLWVSAQDGASPPYATLDAPEAPYGKKIPVHDLHKLLGADQVQRLKDASPVFRDNEISVLQHHRRRPTMKLHLLLWKLQGYLAERSQSGQMKWQG